MKPTYTIENGTLTCNKQVQIEIDMKEVNDFAPEGKYVRVFTDNGDFLVDMCMTNFRDAYQRVTA